MSDTKRPKCGMCSLETPLHHPQCPSIAKPGKGKIALQSRVLSKWDGDAADALEWIKGQGICDEDCESFYDTNQGSRPKNNIGISRFMTTPSTPDNGTPKQRPSIENVRAQIKGMNEARKRLVLIPKLERELWTFPIGAHVFSLQISSYCLGDVSEEDIVALFEIVTMFKRQIMKRQAAKHPQPDYEI